MTTRCAAAALLLLALTGCPDAEPVAPAPAPDPLPPGATATAPDPLPPGATAINPDGDSPPPATDPWPGRYLGQGLDLMLTAEGEGFTGTVSLKGRSYPLTASGEGELKGTFQSGAKEFGFTASKEGEDVRFVTGGTRYALKRVHDQTPRVD